MSEHGDEGQVPEAPGSEAASGLPPRPTLRESLRRGLFVRLPTEGESGEGLPGPEQPAEAYGDPAQADQYGEVVAEEYEGWRQLPDGSWEQVDAEANSYAEGYDPTPTQTYPEVDAGANFASVAGGEPFFQQETSDESAWSYADNEEAAAAPEAEAVVYEEVAVEPAPEELVSEAEVAPEPAPEELVSEAEVAPEPAPEELVSEAEVAPEPIPVPEPPAVEPAPEEVAAEAEATPEPVAVAQAPEESIPEAETVVAPEPAPARSQDPAQRPDDPVASTGLYISVDAELLEGDMPVYGENENVPPMFEGSGLGEPLFIEFGDLSRMLTGLRRLLPTGTRLTYNYDYERAWVRTSADIDLPSFAERVQTLVSEDEKAAK